MNRLLLCLMGTFGLTLAAGCGGEVIAGSGGAGATSGAGTGGASGVTSGPGTTGVAGSTGSGGQSGDCTTDAQCAGGKCVEVTPGGFKVCSKPPVEATCPGGAPPPPGGCCGGDCPGAKCFAPFGSCGGIQPAGNQCLKDQCQKSSDCTGGNQLCLQAGMLGYPVNSCVFANCLTSGECGAAPGGECAPVQRPCCTNQVDFYCVYPGTGCRSNADCPASKPSCIIDQATQSPVCSAEPVACPA